jgi:Ni/Fe-hydrogenase subunit HybB-like protein
MGLIIPGFTPDTLGEIYEYYPTITEVRVAAGVFAVGFLIFTVLLKIAVPIMLADAHREHSLEASAVPDFRHAVPETAVPS